MTARIGNHQKKRIAAEIHNREYERRKILQSGTFLEKLIQRLKDYQKRVVGFLQNGAS